MRVYQLRHYEVMLLEDNQQEAQHLLYYERLCYEMLTVQAISFSGVIEIIRLNNGKVEQRPGRIFKLLSATDIPAFCFIVGKN